MVLAFHQSRYADCAKIATASYQRRFATSSWTAPLLVLLGFFLSSHLGFAQDAPESQTILKYLGNRASAMADALPKRPTTRPAGGGQRSQYDAGPIQLGAAGTSGVGNRGSFGWK